MSQWVADISQDQKENVRLASTATLTYPFSGLAAIDGITPVAGDRILVKDQTTASQNGIWVAASGTWTRPFDANTAKTLSAEHVVRVSEGTTNAHTEWACTTTGAIVPGTTALTYTRSDGTWDAWRPFIDFNGNWAASAGLGTYVMRSDGAAMALSSVALTSGSGLVYLSPTQYAVTGKTIQLRLVGIILGLAAYTGSLSVGLYPVSSFTSAGVPTLGAATQETLVVTNPAAASTNQVHTTAFTMPAAGLYVVTMKASAAMSATAANNPLAKALLQMRAV